VPGASGPADDGVVVPRPVVGIDEDDPLHGFKLRLHQRIVHPFLRESGFISIARSAPRVPAVSHPGDTVSP
jgi:hypothetical protein